jgi:hypothetical protein
MPLPRQGRPAPDLYRLLGVARGAAPADIARAWRHQARLLHPDTRPGDAGAAARFRDLTEAYRVLSDPARRAAYDRTVDQDPHGGTVPLTATAIPVTVLPAPGPPGAPLRAGPVIVAPPGTPPARDTGGAAPLELLAALARYFGAWDRPW